MAMSQRENSLDAMTHLLVETNGEEHHIGWLGRGTEGGGGGKGGGGGQREEGEEEGGGGRRGRGHSEEEERRGGGKKAFNWHYIHVNN